jgi:predicted DNA-binding protein
MNKEKNNKTKKRAVLLCLPETRKKVREIAEREGKLMSQIVKEAVEFYVKNRGVEK